MNRCTLRVSDRGTWSGSIRSFSASGPASSATVLSVNGRKVLPCPHSSSTAVRNDPRRLRIGAFMRRWNIDELPQFWNVLRGDMSLVGPRPERPELIEKFKYCIPHYNARHSIKPGLTGWAQINGFRGDTDLNERVRCDLYYIENWSLLLDFQIMALTFLRHKNAG